MPDTESSAAQTGQKAKPNRRTTMTDNNAKDQAIAQAQSIIAMVAALSCDYDRLEELKDEQESLQADIDNAKDGAIGDTDEPHKALVEWLNENGEELAQLEADAGDNTDADQARERISEDPLSVEYRSGWQSVGETLEASEFRILLCTGGPAVQIRGELDEHMQPSRAWLEAQDWGTPWFHVHIGDGFEGDTLLQYCQQFYFGE
jgi:hypothetical protein